MHAPLSPTLQLGTLQTAGMNKEIMESMRATNLELGKLMATMEDAESIMADHADCVARVDQLAAILQAPLFGSRESEAELEAELRRLTAPAAQAAPPPQQQQQQQQQQIPVHIEDAAVTRSRAAAAAAAAAAAPVQVPA
jgi:hypothetical protein